MNVRRLLPVLLVATVLPGCAGGHKEAVTKVAHTEGIYVDVGALDYQVQLSRQLNPAIVPDRGYLVGLPDYVSELTEDEVWFAVFLRVNNQTDEPAKPAEEFEIEDTTGDVFKPIPIKIEDNPLAYSAAELPPNAIFPSSDSVGGDSPTQGAILLFKIPYASLGNRPLEFKIIGDDGEEAIVDLDI